MPYRSDCPGNRLSKNGRRPRLLLLLAAAATLAALVAVAVPALAAGPPAVTTDAASAVGITTVELTGTVNPEGSSPEPANTTWFFQVSPVGQEAWDGPAAATIEGAQAEGSSPVPVQAIVGGGGELDPATEYEYRLIAEGPGGSATTPSPYPTFTTEAAAATPTLTVPAPTAVSYTSATLQGTVDPEGGNPNHVGGPASIRWQLQYELSSEPGAWQGAGFGTIEGAEAESSSAIAVEAPISGLRPGTPYTVRLIAEYAGADQVTATEEPTFTTESVATPTVTIDPVTAVTATTADFSGEINPNAPAGPLSAAAEEAFKVNWHFQCTPECSVGGGEVPAGSSPVGVSAEAHELIPGVTYEVVLVAEDAGGTGTSATRSFTADDVAPTVESPSVSKVSSTEATLHGEVNPGGTLATTCLFEYGETEGYGLQAPCSPAHPVIAEVQQMEILATEGNFRFSFRGQSTPELPFDASAAAVQAALRGLSSIGPGDASVTATYGAGVSRYRITFEGSLLGVPLERLGIEEGTPPLGGGGGYERSILTEGSLDTPAPVAAALQGLAPGTTYHYRLVVSNGVGPAVETADATFRTYAVPTTGSACPNEAFRTGPSAGLPDCRAFEMVTPVENHDADVNVPRATTNSVTVNGVATGEPFEASTDGSAVAYLADPTVGGYGGTANGLGDQYLATRAADGRWAQTQIQPSSRGGAHYQGFSADLSTGVVLSGVEAAPRLPPLSPEAPGEGYGVLYSCATGQGACTIGGANPYRPLFGTPPNRTPAGFGSQGFGRRGSSVVTTANSDSSGRPAFAGSSAAGDLLYEANDALLPASDPLQAELDADVAAEITHGEIHDYLYDSREGRLSLVDVSPTGQVVPGASFGGPPFIGPTEPQLTDSPDFDHDISADGSRAWWTDLATGVIYLRTNPGQEQSQVVAGHCTEAAKACTVQVSAGDSPAQYWDASTDGRYAFYTEAGRLYRYDAETEDREELTTGPGAEVLGVPGTSADGSTVYFVANGALAPGAQAGDCTVGEPEPTTNSCDLYRWQGDTTTLVAELSGRDGQEVEPFISVLSGAAGEYGDWQPGLAKRTAEVSANGESITFMSERSLPVAGYPHGYPNQGGEEAYLYSAAAGELFCLSCSPAGEPGTSGFLPISWTATYLPHWVSADGDEAFFDTPSALVPGDTNNTQDVYEWARAGTGTCAEADAVDGGCLSLLSGGTADTSSWLLGAGESGEDVFVITRAHLTPEDGNEAYDLYDAHVGGTRPEPEPACVGAGCQVEPPLPPARVAPSTDSFHGPGDEGGRPSCPKGKARRHGRCVKKKAHRRHRRRAHHKRAAGHGHGGGK